MQEQCFAVMEAARPSVLKLFSATRITVFLPWYRLRKTVCMGPLSSLSSHAQNSNPEHPVRMSALFAGRSPGSQLDGSFRLPSLAKGQWRNEKIRAAYSRGGGHGIGLTGIVQPHHVPFSCPAVLQPGGQPTLTELREKNVAVNRVSDIAFFTSSRKVLSALSLTRSLMSGIRSMHAIKSKQALILLCHKVLSRWQHGHRW